MSLQLTSVSHQFLASCEPILTDANFFLSLFEFSVHISSVLVLIGIGSYLWYRYMLRKIRKARESLESQKEQIAKSSPLTWKDLPNSNNLLSSSPNCTLAQSSRPIPHDVTQQDTSSIADQSTETSSLRRSLSLSSSSANDSLIGDTTVAKLDMLLGHIEDIKKSVIEIDAGLTHVEKSAKKANRTILDHSPVSSRFSCGINDISSFLPSDESSCPPTPTLEWDSHDIDELVPPRNHHLPFLPSDESCGAKLFSCIDLNLDDTDDTSLYFTSDETLSQIANRPLQLDLEAFSSGDFSQRETHSPSPSSSSGQGSDLPSPADTLPIERPARKDRVNEILKEIRKHGIAHELLNELMKQVNRDSAFYEE